MDKEIFEYIRSYTIKILNHIDDNQFGYVDRKIESIDKIKNDEDYSGMFVLNTLHVLSRRHIINKLTPIKVIHYVTENSEDLKSYLEGYDEDLYLLVKRYKITKEILSKKHQNLFKKI
tara:strand:+ start:116 stop:469 length:354 start_codon:yes stop_codon:yes gene_type:complete